MQTVQWKNLTAEIPIIGFTGALGSGCTKFATTLCSEHNYKYYKLSDKILEVARQKRIRTSVGNMQDLGNSLRREFGLDYLALAALEKADADWKSEDEGKYSGRVNPILS